MENIADRSKMSVASKELKLCSPVNAEVITYVWPLCRGRNYNGAVEILDTIRLVCNDCQELKTVFDKMVGSDVDLNSYECVKTLCDKFNKAATAYKNLWKGMSKFPTDEVPSPTLLRHVVHQVYNRSVTEPEKLNTYEPFTPAVYGETSFELIAKMIELLKPTEEDVFIDLGSGVGQVVIQMAGGSKCKRCIGIEKEDCPTQYARRMEFEFRKWMKWYGKSYNEFQLIEGDFLDEKFRDLMMNCSIIFVNNFAFGPEVDHKLKQIFADMHDGTRIVSSKAFCQPNVRISDRNLSDIGTIMNVTELWSQTGVVSWTNNPVTYYLHVIDRKRLEEYFASIRNNGGNSSRPELRRSGSKASNQSWSSRESASSHSADFSGAQHIPMEERENIVVGTMTRRQFASWVAQKEKQGSGSSQSHAPPKPLSTTPKTPDTASVSAAAEEMDEDNSGSNEDDIENEDEDNEFGDDGEFGDGEERSTSSSKPKLASGFKQKGRPRKSQTTLKAQQAKRKYQKQRRPSKTSKKVAKRKDQEWMGALNMLHQQIVSASASLGDGQTAAVTQRQPIQFGSQAMLEIAPNPPGFHAALESHLARQRTQLENFFAHMGTPQYRAHLLESIEKESNRQRILRERACQLEHSILNLQEEGVNLLRARMAEVGIQAETPAELLNKAKEIVMDHQALQNRASNLDLELRNLERHNEYLVALCRERDDQVIRSGLLQSMGYSNALTADDAKTAILREIGLLFSRRRILLLEMTKFENEIQAMESNFPQNINTDALLNQLQLPSTMAAPVQSTNSSDSTTANSGANLELASSTSPHSGDTASRVPVAKGTGTARKRGSTSTPRRKTAAKASRGKQKTTPAATVPTPAAPSATTAAASSSTPAEEGTQEDIEEKIRDIVRKALSVDNAAKRAEKERKARTAERKRGGKTTGGVEQAAKTTPPATTPKPKNGSKGNDSTQKDRAGTSSTDIDQTISETISNFTSTLGSRGRQDSTDRTRSRTSSATESAPSDHEDFQDERSSGLPETMATENKENTGKEKMKKTFITAFKSTTDSDQQRPSSVPVSQHSSAGQFSISSLIAAAAAESSTGSVHTMYPRVTSAFARMEHVSTTTTAPSAQDDTISGVSESTATTTADSGFSESRPIHYYPMAVGEPTTSSVPDPNPFNGASANVGQPGNPHSLSNPGNPVTSGNEEKSYANPFKGTSNTGNAGNPHDYSNPGNPSTPDEMDLAEPKVLQPFRIPRRATKETTATESPETRSPLAQVGLVKKEETTSSWMPNTSGITGASIKRKKKDQDMSPMKKRLMMPDTTVTPFDQIMNAMIVPGHAVAASKKPSRSRSIHSETSSNGSRKKAEPSTSAAGRPTTLTKETLDRHAANQEVYKFAEKGLMEALLEHKMMAGRIESHSQIANKLRLEMFKKKPAAGGPGTPPGSPRQTVPATVPAAAAANRRGPKTPENTPPSSPVESIHSQSSRRSNYSGVSALEQDSLNAQPTGSATVPQSSIAAPVQQADQRESRSPSNARTLETLARLTHIDAGQLAKCLNEDALRTLQNIDPTLLVATLSTLLSTVVKSVNRPSLPSQETTTVVSSLSRRSVEEAAGSSGRDKSEELVTSTSVEEKSHQQQIQQQQQHLQPVEMDIDNSSHDGSPAQENDRNPYGQQMKDQSLFAPSSIFATPEQQSIAQFQPHQLFQPLFSMPPPSLGLASSMCGPNSMFMTPPPTSAMIHPHGPEMDAIQQQQELLQQMFLLMQMMQGGPIISNNYEPFGDDGTLALGGMRDCGRWVKDYHHGDQRRRQPSPEPTFTMPPPPRPVRVDYSYGTPRELAIIGHHATHPIGNDAMLPTTMMMNDRIFRPHRPRTPTRPPLIHDQVMAPQRFPGLPPNPFGHPSMPMRAPTASGLPSLLNMEPSFVPPPRLGFRQGQPGRIGRGRGMGRPFRP